ncbi:MAG: alpha/beta fold hydrolase [Candidatus Eremiobacteraeota bacterium]|nr:alpha/beta fold hydrolase [Candidatus Eremiobacteraeota bacterium]
MSNAETFRPATNYAEACARFDALRALDDDKISNAAHSRLYDRGARVPLAVVLLHGFTNCPEQWSRFAEELFDRGHNVVVPRLPGHGDAGRSCARLAKMKVADFVATTNDALDIAHGLGERVVVAGLSLSGTLAAHAAIQRDDVARALSIVPLLGLSGMTPWRDALLAFALRTLPNVNFPWDPFGAEKLIPMHAYPAFPTHGLAESLRFGLAEYRAAVTHAPAGTIIMVTNANDPAIDNAMCAEIVRRWNSARRGSATAFQFLDLPKNHDIIDPSNPLQRTAEIYPKLRDLVEAALP